MTVVNMSARFYFDLPEVTFPKDTQQAEEFMDIVFSSFEDIGAAGIVSDFTISRTPEYKFGESSNGFHVEFDLEIADQEKAIDYLLKASPVIQGKIKVLALDIYEAWPELILHLPSLR